MKQYLEALKRQAEENPMAALAIAGLVVTAVAKFMDSAGRYRGSAAYARDVDRRIRNS